MPNPEQKNKYSFNKLTKRLQRQVGMAIHDYQLIEDGDRVMVCLSGGKDSYTMLEMLRHMQQHAPINFELVAVNLDQKQPDYPEHILPAYLDQLGIEYHIINEDTYSIVKRVLPEGKTMCSLCSRLRRGNLYTFAKKINATKIALGHHRDDILQTFFLNLFFGGKLSAMPIKLLSDSKEHLVIRPLGYCKEDDISHYASVRQFPIIPCNLCGSQPNLQRQVIKQMLRNWDQDFPGRSESLFRSLQNCKPSQLLDRELFDFGGLGTQGGEIPPDKLCLSDPL